MGRYERVYDDMGGYDNLRNIKVTKSYDILFPF